jgi:hypothetical protein
MSDLIDRIFDVEKISAEVKAITDQITALTDTINTIKGNLSTIGTNIRKSKGMDDLTIQSQTLNNEFSKGQKTIIDYQKKLAELQEKTERLTGAEKAANIEIEKARLELVAANKQIKEAALAAFELEGKNRPLATSYNALVLQLKNSIAAFKELTLEEQKSARGQELLKKINDTQNALKGTDAMMGNYQRNVGNYVGALQTLPGVFGDVAAQGQSLLSTVQEGFKKVIESITGYSEALALKKDAEMASAAASAAAEKAEKELSIAIAAGTATSEQTVAAEKARAAATKAATIATEASSNAMKMFKVALASTGIGLIVVALGSLIAYFTQTNTGSKLLSKSLAVVGAVFKELVGFVAKAVQGVIDFVGGIKSFPDLLTKIGKGIEENLINRFKAFGVIFNGVMDIVHGHFGAGIKEILNGVLQAGSGVTDVIDKVEKAGKAVAKGVNDAGSAKAKIEDMRRALEKYETESVTALANLEAKSAEYQRILSKAGQTLSVKEREEAVKGFIATENQKLAIQLNIAGQRAQIAKAELDLEQKQTGDAMESTRRTYADAQAELIRIRGEYNETRLNADARAAKLFEQILQEQITAEKDAANQSKTILEDKLKNENLSLDEQLSIIEQIKQANDSSYEQQKESFQEYVDLTTKGTKKIIDFNELLKISDGKVLQAKMTELGLSIDAQKVLLTLLSERRAAVEKTNQDETNLAKKRVDLIISNMQAELTINDLKNKEIRAGRQSTFEEELADLKEHYESDINQLELNHKNKLITDEEYFKKKKELEQRYATDSATITADAEQMKIDAQKLSIATQLSDKNIGINKELELTLQQNKIEREEKIKAAKGNAEMIAAINVEYDQKDINAFAKATKRKEEIISESINAAAQLFSSALDFQIKQSQQIIDSLEKQKEAQDAQFEAQEAALDKAVMSEATRAQKKTEIEKKKAAAEKVINDKIQAEKVKQAKWEREKEISDAIVSAALAIIKAWDAEPPLDWIAGSLASAMAAIQIATILSTPLPAYAEGTQNHPGGLSLWGEKQPEVAVLPSGKAFIADKPTITNFDAGTKIYKSVAEYENYINKETTNQFVFDYQKLAEAMPKDTIELNGNGSWTLINKTNNRRTVINRRYTLGN